MRKNIIILLLIIISTQLRAQDITGSWLGSIAISGIDLRLAFHIKKRLQTPAIPQQLTARTKRYLAARRAKLMLKKTAFSLK